ncbi:amidohydrolase family protein [candidate division KSB1 bacterium]|nr:amidohydrolase family protein [candidate division KSB1 bacterium]
MTDILIKNGFVCLNKKIEPCDVLIADRKIAAIGTDMPQIDNVIDAARSYVLPGFMDIHTHMADRIGNYELADSYASATKLAVQNGIATIYNFITQSPAETLAAAIEKAQCKAMGNTYCNVGWHLTPTTFNDAAWNEIDDWIAQGFKTFKFYTTYKDAGLYCTYDQIKHIAKRLKQFNITLLVHCEDEYILEQSVPQLDRTNPFSHTRMRPPSAEWTAIEQIIRIASETGVKIHVVHVSTAQGIERIHAAKSTASITCETAPHYLYLNESRFQDESGHYYLCSPPLRSEQNQQQLLQHARNGWFDVYATDHCPFLKQHKDANKTDIQRVPKGIAGLGALAPMIFELYKQKGYAGIIDMAQKLSANPAKIVGLYPRKGVIEVGADADVVILKDGGTKRKIVSSYSDTFEPYHDFSSTLQVEYVILDGEVVVRDGKMISGKPKGMMITKGFT